MNHGFFRVAAAVPRVNVADSTFNAENIIEMASRADSRGARVVVFPEMSVTTYTCADLFHNKTLINSAVQALNEIARRTAALDCLIVVGAPLLSGEALYNCAIAMRRGKILLAVPKTYIPTYNEFYESRWFRSAADTDTSADIYILNDVPMSSHALIEVDGVKVGIEICEDLWAPVPPSSNLALAGAQIILNLSASDDLIGKYSYLRKLVAQQSARCLAAYVYAGAGYGESSTDLVFDGKAIIAENGEIISEAPRWTGKPSLVINDIDIQALNRDRMHINTFADCARNNIKTPYRIIQTGLSSEGEDFERPLLREINPTPFVPASDEHIAERCEEITNIQVAGLARRMEATRCKSLVVGISGGLDSTLALLVAVKTFDRLGIPRSGIVGVTMPGFGTTGRTYNNALTLMRTLGITMREIPIAEAVSLHFRDIGHDPSVTDVTYENSQARERTQILMDIANQTSGMVLGTGDLSELALGWATYNGDHISMYGVNAGVPKTLVRYLVRHFADATANAEERAALLDVIDTPISPELTPASDAGEIQQKTEDLVGPYELHDFFLYYMLRYGFSPAKIFFLACNAFADRNKEEIKHWLKTFFRRFFSQQFKRSCLPDGPKVGSVCLSPRGDWRMPSDASASLWLHEAESL